ncbi:MAG: hypothetical protein LQ339_001315 [Xanthoria mediterranea]|nr:MAG: hypothetical protein LQ339_001315 [Xanthoria mediterranea]
MVCAKCQKLKSTSLATPAVKKKNEMYYGSPAGSAGRVEKSSASNGSAAAGKSKLLSKSAKNPYAQYASTCRTCKTKTDSGKTYCQRCAYKANACAVCGKSQTKAGSSDGPVVQGQKFSAK